MIKEIIKTNDFFARFFFGSKWNEDLLLSFINAIMIDSNFATLKYLEILNPLPKAYFSLNIKNKIDNKESIIDCYRNYILKYYLPLKFDFD